MVIHPWQLQSLDHALINRNYHHCASCNHETMKMIRKIMSCFFLALRPKTIDWPSKERFTCLPQGLRRESLRISKRKSSKVTISTWMMEEIITRMRSRKNVHIIKWIWNHYTIFKCWATFFLTNVWLYLIVGWPFGHH